MEVQLLRARKEPHSTSTQELVSKSSSDGVNGSRTKYKLLESVDPKHMGVAMRLISKSFSWAVADGSELIHDGEWRRREWSRRGE